MRQETPNKKVDILILSILGAAPLLGVISMFTDNSFLDTLANIFALLFMLILLIILLSDKKETIRIEAKNEMYIHHPLCSIIPKQRLLIWHHQDGKEVEEGISFCECELDMLQRQIKVIKRED